MTQTVRIALPVPAAGHGIGDEGDAYVSSLLVEITVDGQVMTRIDGTAFELLVTAARLRHLAFHPRTRAFVPGNMKSRSLAERLERNWSCVDSLSSLHPGLVELAESTIACGRRGMVAAWRQVN